MERKETMVELLKGIYKDIETNNTGKYGEDFIANMVLARPEINKQFKLLKEAGVPYSDKIVYKVLENVGVAKYF